MKVGAEGYALEVGVTLLYPMAAMILWLLQAS